MCDKTNKKDDCKETANSIVAIRRAKVKICVFADGFKSLIKHLINAFAATEAKVLH